MKIDVHAHIIPDVFPATPEGGFSVPEAGTRAAYRVARFAMPGLMGDPARGGHGGPAGAVGMISPAMQGNSGDLSNWGRRLLDMDSQGLDMHVLSMPPIYFYGLPADQAVRVCQSVNNALAEMARRDPSRFIAIADLPMQAPEAAARELERCVRELGMRGAEICTNIAGTNLDDPSFAPVWAKMQELDVPFFLHPSNVLGQDRLGSYHLGNLIGNPTDTAVAAASLIFGGVLKQFPGATFYLAHAGGSCPYLRGRWEHGWRVRAEGKVNIQKPPSEYFRLLYFDTLAHSVQALNYLVEVAGADHVMLGTDYPFDMADTDPVKSIQGLSISNGDKELIYGGNAARLFKIARS